MLRCVMCEAVAASRSWVVRILLLNKTKNLEKKPGGYSSSAGLPNLRQRRGCTGGTTLPGCHTPAPPRMWLVPARTIATVSQRVSPLTLASKFLLL